MMCIDIHHNFLKQDLQDNNSQSTKQTSWLAHVYKMKFIFRPTILWFGCYFDFGRDGCWTSCLTHVWWMHFTCRAPKNFALFLQRKSQQILCMCFKINAILVQSHKDECLVPNEFRPRRSQLGVDGLLEDPRQVIILTITGPRFRYCHVNSQKYALLCLTRQVFEMA